MAKKTGLIMVGALIILLAGASWTQQKKDEVPDAPSASQPPAPFPATAPGDSTAPPSSSDSDQPAPPPTELKPPAGPPHSAPEAPETETKTETKTAPPPMPPVKTVADGSVPAEGENSREELFKISVVLNYVTVPVTVKGNDGRLVAGLSSKDFTVLENGRPQNLKFFTSDPFPLSAAVIFDLGMPDSGVRKVQETLPALQGAFSQFDEIAIYTYSSTVSRVSDFTTIGQQLTAVLNRIKTYSGRNNGAPVTGGPLGPQGPTINGHPIDSPIQPVITPPKESHVINDAILLAARDLSKRDRTRRKIIFVISDGHEIGSEASYADTLKVLQTQNVIVYAVGVEGAAIPGYGKLQKIRLPRVDIPGGVGSINFGTGNILPKYVSATGGGTVYAENAKADIEKAYARAIGDARNQYTLAYSAKPGAGGYREIEVLVKRPDVKVYSKAGYYPLPAPK